MTYPGGKGNCYHQIINLIPPHDYYIETHLGGGTIMEMKKPAPGGSFGIEIDSNCFKEYDFNISNLELANLDIFEFIKNWQFKLWTQSFPGNIGFVYCDPPYLRSTRKSQKGMYRYEMTEEQHIKLLEVLIKLSCMVMISGYESLLYKEMLQNWNMVQFQNTTRQGPVTECLWMNYDKPTELHDYRYLGKDFRERERIQKKTKRWVNNLKQMPELERNAIVSAIDKINQ